MARTSDDLNQPKRKVPIVEACRACGIELKKHGAHDYIGKCPFDEDESLSFVVSPGKNLYHCKKCNVKGSIIELIMELYCITFRDAVAKLFVMFRRISRAQKQGSFK